MPGVLRSLKKQTLIAPWNQRGGDCQIIESRGRMGFETFLVVQNQDLASPIHVPIRFGVEIKNMRSQLASGIAVGRDGTTLPGVVPLQGQDEFPRAKHPAKKGLVSFSM